MASDLLAIARSGTKAARAALDVTGQNIANASTTGYVRRSVSLSEVSASGGLGRGSDISLSGVRINGVVRNADAFRQAEVRRTGADASRAQAEVQGLENIEAAVEQAGVYDAVVDFEAALKRLASDPTSGSLRAAVIESTRALASSFQVSSTSLDAAGEGLRFQAADDVSQVNLLAAELGRVNARLSRASESSSDQSTLLDQRDNLLQQLSERIDVSASFKADKTVEIRVGGSAGPQLLDGQTTTPLTMTTAADGTIALALGGTAVTPATGALAGRSQALGQLVTTRQRLDATATSVIAAVNTAQANGADLDGAADQPLLTGTGAGDMALATSDGDKIATAAAGAPAGSRDGSNLAAMRAALEAASPSRALDALLFDVSSAVAGRTVTRDALQTIAGNARVSLQAQAGVDLDQEAVNLVRYQQAFQASGRVMQVASDIFDSLLNIR